MIRVINLNTVLATEKEPQCSDALQLNTEGFLGLCWSAEVQSSKRANKENTSAEGISQ